MGGTRRASSRLRSAAVQIMSEVAANYHISADCKLRAPCLRTCPCLNHAPVADESRVSLSDT